MAEEERLHQCYLSNLKKDPHFRRLPAPQQEDLVSQCLAWGERMAEMVKQALGPADEATLCAWARQQGVQVHYLETKYDLPYIAEYTPLKKTIDLYTRRIRQMQSTLEKNHPEYFESHTLAQMCLAHELFHHLECTENRTTGKLISAPAKALGLFPYRHYFPEGSEIAAHRFVSLVLDLEFSTYTFADEMIAQESQESEEDQNE